MQKRDSLFINMLVNFRFFNLYFFFILYYIYYFRNICYVTAIKPVIKPQIRLRLS